MSIRDARDTVVELLFELGRLMVQQEGEQALSLFTETLDFSISVLHMDRADRDEHPAARAGAPFASLHMFSNTRILTASDGDIEAVVIGATLKIETRDGWPSTTLLAADWRVRAQRSGDRWLLKAVTVTPVEPPR